MASILSAGTTSGTALNMSGDTSGVLQLASNNGTVGVTLDTSSNVGIGTATPNFESGTGKGLQVNYSGGLGAHLKLTDSESGSGATDGFDLYAYNTSGYVENYEAGSIVFRNGGSERMRIDSSGNVGIGTSSPTFATGTGLQVKGAGFTSVRVTNASSTGVDFSQDTSANGYMYNRDNAALIYGTNNTERMRINSGGQLLVNNTATLYTGQHNIRGGDNSGTGVLTTQSATTTSYYHTVGTTSGGAFVVYAGNGSFNGAYIVWGATSWSANSDARLKNVTGTYTNALSDITQIQPVKFTWKSDETNTSYVGVIAQSVQNVVPEAMSQNKLPSSGDETEYLGVRYTDLIPLMIASIQELKAINDTQAETINALTARIVALEQA
jgi:hypothetical protein